MKYIAPNKDLSAFTCPYCHTLAQMEQYTHHFENDLFCLPDEEWYTYPVQIFRCTNCGEKIIWVNGNYAYPDI